MILSGRYHDFVLGLWLLPLALALRASVLQRSLALYARAFQEELRRTNWRNN